MATSTSTMWPALEQKSTSLHVLQTETLETARTLRMPESDAMQTVSLSMGIQIQN